MIPIRNVSILLAGLVPLLAAAQFVKGNEAVTTPPAGVRTVETPPLPSSGPARTVKPCLAAAGCHAGAWIMVETAQGLAECTEPYARSGTCRDPTYGKDRLLRIWLVKRNGAWLQCSLADLGSKCVDLAARPPSNLPFPAVQ